MGFSMKAAVADRQKRLSKIRAERNFWNAVELSTKGALDVLEKTGAVTLSLKDNSVNCQVVHKLKDYFYGDRGVTWKTENDRFYLVKNKEPKMATYYLDKLLSR